MNNNLSAHEAKKISKKFNRKNLEKISIDKLIILINMNIELKCYDSSTNNQYLDFIFPRKLSESEVKQTYDYFKSNDFKLSISSHKIRLAW